MIFGEYPCCGGFLSLAVPDKTPAYLPENCPHCGAKVWHRISRVDPISWTDADFLVEHDVDETSKQITRKPLKMAAGGTVNPNTPPPTILSTERVIPWETALRFAINAARRRAAVVGPQHALWDVIGDAEALLAGKPTIVDYGSREQAIRTLIEQLKPPSGKTVTIAVFQR